MSYRSPWRGLITAAAMALALGLAAFAQGYPAQAAPSARTPQPAAVARAAPHPAVLTARPDAGGGDGCNPRRANDFLTFRFDGWYRDPGTTVGGVYSDIYNYSPWVYYISAQASAVAAWTMVDLSSNANTWAQVGWVEFPLGKRYVFTQTNNNGNLITHYFSPKPINSQAYYTTLYNNTPGHFSYQVSGSTIEVDPAGFTPNEGQNFGETHSFADQMPGGYNQNEYFNDTHIYYSGGWHNFSGTVADSSSAYGYSHPSSTEMLIWDKACPN